MHKISFIGLFLLSLSQSYAANTWCISDPANPPCEGARGKCTLNKDGSLGGFVARTARVKKTGWFRQKNGPFIGQFAQICGHSYVSEKARIEGTAQISGNAWVTGNAQVRDNARVFGNSGVFGNAQVFHDAWIFENARIFENAQVYGRVRVSGNARVAADARLFGDEHIFGRTEIISNSSTRYRAHDVEKPLHPVMNPNVEVTSDDECSICLDGFTDERKAVGIPCSHKFHQECIEHWVIDQKRRTCPNCRAPTPMVDPNAPSS